MFFGQRNHGSAAAAATCLLRMLRPTAAYTSSLSCSIIHRHIGRRSKSTQSMDPSSKLPSPHRLLWPDSAARRPQRVPADPATQLPFHCASVKGAYHHTRCRMRGMPQTTGKMESEQNTSAYVATQQSPDAQMNDTPSQSPDVNPRKRARDDTGDDAEENDDEPGQDNADSKTSETPADGTENQPRLSKNQLKKLKRQKMWEQKKEDRKALRKDKRHEKSARRRLERDERASKLAEEQGIDKGAALKQILAAEQKEPRPRAAVPVAFIIDCDFEKYMREPELVSLGAQVTRSYAMNRAGQYQAHILVSSWGGYLKERFATVLRNTHLNYKGVRFVECDFVEAGKTAWEIMHGPKGGRPCPALGGAQQATKKESGDKPAKEEMEADKDEAPAENEAAPVPDFTTDSIVYLSADSPHTLEKLEPYTTYVIGGLVDRNREKLLCQKRAEAKGIRTAKLPIGDYMQMASRQVLATNHVVEIMSKWLETGDWGTAFEEVIPKRKGGKLKGAEGQDEGDEEDGKDAEVEVGQSDKQDEQGQDQDQQGEKQEGSSEAPA